MSAQPETSGFQIPPLPDTEGLRADLERVRSATYTGRDPEHIVTAVVDGDGVVVRIRFGATASSRPPEAAGRAVVNAIAAAQRLAIAAARSVAERHMPEVAGGHRDGRA